MGKRLIPKRNRTVAKRDEQPDATDFGTTDASTGSGELQPLARDVSEPVADEIADGTIDPESYAGSDSDSSGPDSGSDTGSDSGTGKRRGRRKGTKNRTTQKAQTTVTTRILFSIHGMGAAFLKQPMLQITDQEAEALAVAIQRVQEQYDMFTLTDKQEAWIQLGIACAGIYGPRVVAVIAMEKMKKQQQHENFQNAQNATQMPDLETIKRAQNV